MATGQAPEATAVTESRTEILRNIRGALGRNGPIAASIDRSLRQRISAQQPAVRPTYSDDPVTRFLTKHAAVHGTYDRVATPSDVIPAIVAYLERHAMVTNLVTGSGTMIDTLRWPEHFKLERRPALKTDKAAVSQAFAGIAETGTLVLLSAPSNPASHNYLPDDQIVLIDDQRIVRYQEDVWSLLRNELSCLPRTVSLITGPSKTGDVEQTIEYGAHGPRRLHVILVGPQAETNSEDAQATLDDRSPRT